MAKKSFRKYWPAGVGIVGVAYACSGSPDAVLRPNPGDDDGQGAVANGTGRGGSSGTGGTGVLPTGGKGGRGGKGGSGATEGGASGDGGEGGIRDAGLPDVGFHYDASSDEDADACAAVTGTATLVKRPMDIIISIDNSGSMAGEINAVIARINTDFAAIIEASMIDYRVIMVTRYGYLNYNPDPTNYSVCIGPPLGNAACTQPNGPAPTLVNKPPRFYHHSTDIGSNNMWCRLLGSYTQPDEYPASRTGWTVLAPNGWQSWLRPNAFKVFIGITDDNPLTTGAQGCRATAGGINDPGGLADTLAGAQTFDRAIRTLAPTQFGAYTQATPDANRNYRWYSIVGLAAKAAPNQTVPYQPTEPVVPTVCTNGGGNNDGVGSGLGYQELSRMTGGLRYSNCLNANFDAIFNAIAQGVIEGARASCEYNVPTPAGGILDPTQTVVSYQQGGVPPGTSLPRVASDTACAAPGGFYFNQDFSKIFLCPTTCAAVQNDLAAKIAIDFGCLGS